MHDYQRVAREYAFLFLQVVRAVKATVMISSIVISGTILPVELQFEKEVTEELEVHALQVRTVLVGSHHVA